MPSAKKKMEEIFNNVETVNKSKGYYILKRAKRLISKWYSDIVIKCKIYVQQVCTFTQIEHDKQE